MAPSNKGNIERMRLTTLMVAATLLLPATASAAGGGNAAVQDCQDGKIDGTYTAAEYRDALKAIPTDVDEYTDCRDVIRSAQLRAAGSSSAGGGSAAPGTPTPAGAPPASAPGAPGAAPSGAPAASAGTVQPSSSGGAAASSDAPAATDPAVPSAPASQAPGTAPPPRIPGLPTDTAILTGAGGDPGTGPVPVATASRVTEQVPPALALVLVLLAGGLLVVRLRVRRAAD